MYLDRTVILVWDPWNSTDEVCTLCHQSGSCDIVTVSLSTKLAGHRTSWIEQPASSAQVNLWMAFRQQPVSC